MKLILQRLGMALVIWGVLLGAAAATELILPLDQVKAGMKGVGKTVLKGNSIEQFNVEILDVLRNEPSVGPRKSVILARLSGAGLEESGVAQGMSGSPVYIDGKLVGAVAYSFAFATAPIAGITPIEEMLAIQEYSRGRSQYTVPQAVRKYMSMSDLLSIHRHLFPESRTESYSGRAMTPLRIPLVFSGFSPRAFDSAQPFFSGLGFSPVWGSTAQAPSRVDVPDMSLRAGEAVGVQLITGDLNMAATGTVTYVDGNKVLAFGHPMYNLGPVEYAMTRARVITVLPSVNVSQKMAVTEGIVGRIVQDRITGVFGELGRPPRMVPVNLSIRGADEKQRDYRVQIVEDKILTPFLVNTTVSSLLFGETRQTGDLSLALKGNIFLDDGRSIPLEDMFTGNFDSAVANIANLVTAVTYFVSNNEFKQLGVHRIDLDFQTIEEVRTATLEKVWLDKYDVSPGELIQVRIMSRTYRGESVPLDGAIPAPNLPSGSEFYLVVADTQSLAQLERSQYRSQGFMPRSLNQLIRVLGSQRKNNRIYFKILAEKPGLFLKGEELPNLPPSMKSMFSSRRAATSPPQDLNRSTLIQFQQAVPFVFQGMAVLPVKIK